MITPARRHVVSALVVSFVLHIVGVWLVHRVHPPAEQAPLLRLRLPRRQIPMERLETRPAVPVERSLLERLRATGSPRAAPQIAGGGEAAPMPEVELPAEEFDVLTRRKKASVEALRDTLIKLALGDPEWGTNFEADLGEFDAQRRHRTTVLVDRDTGKLLKAYLHVPSYRNYLSPPCEWHGGAGLEGVLVAVESGRSLPTPPPFENEVHWFDLRGCSRLGDLEADPIHRFSIYPRRDRLSHEQLRDFPFIDLAYIDVYSTREMVTYLSGGGFALMDAGQFYHVKRELQKALGERVGERLFELGHPVFDFVYAVDRYQDESNRLCPSFGPLTALVLDGRLLSLTGVPSFNPQAACPANRVYVNAIAYALTQPSKLGGRFGATGRQ